MKKNNTCGGGSQNECQMPVLDLQSGMCHTGIEDYPLSFGLIVVKVDLAEGFILTSTTFCKMISG